MHGATAPHIQSPAPKSSAVSATRGFLDGRPARGKRDRGERCPRTTTGGADGDTGLTYLTIQGWVIPRAGGGDLVAVVGVLRAFGT